MSRFDQCHTPGFSSDEPTVSNSGSGNAGEMLRPASSGHPMSLGQCLFVVGLFVLALVFSYFVVFRIDPFAVDLYRSTSHGAPLAAASQGDRL
jgi:hypothetical protein